MTDNLQQCGNCRYFDGQCKRYPMYVDRKPTDWCGEWFELCHPPKESPIEEMTEGKAS